MNFRDQIITVMSQSKKPMSCDEIASKLEETFGPIPWNSIQAELERDIVNEGSKKLKTHPSGYTIRPNEGAAETKEEHSGDHLDLPGAITCYGNNWHRARVAWKAPLELIGSQTMSSMKINFADQIGFYALGWGIGEPIEFIGFSGERTIGECLLEHSKDRLRGRWTHFSFYGLRPILEDGSFGPLPESVTLAEATASMLSVLVDVVQPRAYCREDDYFCAMEFAQR